MRIYLYLLAGITSTLIGWNIGQFFLADLGILKPFPEVVLFPSVAISLAMGMVMNEIFISNPTRPKLNFRVARIPLLIAGGLGLLAGLIGGGIAQIVFLPFVNIPIPVLRTLGWLFIGAAVGLAEGLTWRWHSLEAGDPKRFWKRFKTSVAGGVLASLVAAFIFEFIRLPFAGQMPNALRAAEDPIGFSILGLFLGLTFSLTNSPSYMAALRAGAGFEYTGEIFDDVEPIDSYMTIPNPIYPSIDPTMLTFVSDSSEARIEEGLSIRLPEKGSLKIGSSEKANIYIPDLPLHIADLDLKAREAVLKPNPRYYSFIAVNGNRLGTRQPILLKHNYLITFYPKEQEDPNEEKIYRFVYYNRFLDPQS